MTCPECGNKTFIWWWRSQVLCAINGALLRLRTPPWLNSSTRYAGAELAVCRRCKLEVTA